MKNTTPTPSTIAPEYLRVKEATKFSGLSRAKLYEALTDGRIKSYSVRDPGKTRGTRLISASSLREFIESHAVPAQ
jgi:excisionase family DNA binding protein